MGKGGCFGLHVLGGEEEGAFEEVRRTSEVEMS